MMSAVLTRDDVRLALADPTVTVVDALPAGAYGRRHLPGAVNLAVEQIDSAADVLPDRAAAVVVYSTDEGCDRGPGLAAALEARGYSDVRVYQGGIEDWVGAGLPVDSGA
jgi:rhodanese-related sulfurtransferase